MFDKIKLGGAVKVARMRSKLLKKGVTKTDDLIAKQASEKIKHRYIIRYDSKYKLAWDTIIILLAIFNSIFIPLTLAFKPPFSETNFYEAINTTIDSLFFVDIAV